MKLLFAVVGVILLAGCTDIEQNLSKFWQQCNDNGVVLLAIFILYFCIKNLLSDIYYKLENVLYLLEKLNRP